MDLLDEYHRSYTSLTSQSIRHKHHIICSMILKDILQMYDLLVCTCGNPLGFIFEFSTLKQLNFSVEGEKFIQILEKIFKEFKTEHHRQIRHFIFVSCQHFQVYQIYNTKVAIELLIKQYQQFWDTVPEHKLSDELVDLIYKNKQITELFNIFHVVKGRTLDTRTSTINLQKMILDSQKITKQCCRSRILTNVDFYTSRAYYASKLTH